ncbi:uncharacterized protein H6S33_007953 [Morchella sextelata]|uniref:uncharacterized protein n=1 Tax=Morchella sextelata TaxID=1174677 RepID=UPI001D059A4C|nr:uncharacterized protein H6S33_007953 [Morchella sextelata]KAH0602949.1 hypothetical protein H6S33_007953 [Morchella sextelata]
MNQNSRLRQLTHHDRIINDTYPDSLLDSGWGWKLRSRSLPVDPGAHCSGEQYIFCDFEVIEKGLCKEGEREGDGEREAIGFSLVREMLHTKVVHRRDLLGFLGSMGSHAFQSMGEFWCYSAVRYGSVGIERIRLLSRGSREQETDGGNILLA